MLHSIRTTELSPHERPLHVTKSTRPLDRFRRHIPAELITHAAAAARYGERRRKCPPDIFFWTLVLGFASEAARGLASFQRFFCVLTGTTITSSAFQKRFTPQGAAFLAGVLDHLLARAGRGASAPAFARIERFRAVFAIDSSLVRLHRKLQKHFRGFKSAGTEAMARLHVVHNLTHRDIERLRITGGRVPEIRGAAFGRWTKGALSLFDLGYYSHAVFRTIDDAGGFFISRMKSHANPRVISVRRGGRMTAVKGVLLRDLRVGESVLEAEAVFGEGPGQRIYRVVAVREPISGTWRYYVTNLGAAEFSANEIAELYRLRWEIELLFKELKSSYRLDEVATTKAATARCLMLAALISLLVGRILAEIATARSGQALRSLSPRRVAAVLAQHGVDIGRALLEGVPKRIGRVLARIADVCTAIAGAAPPRGGAAGRKC